MCIIIKHKAMSHSKGTHSYDALSNNITDREMSCATEGTNVSVRRDTGMQLWFPRKEGIRGILYKYDVLVLYSVLLNLIFFSVNL